MKNIISILRLVLLFVNYIICTVVCRNVGMLKETSVVVLIGGSMLLLCGSVILLYRCININVMYNGIYATLMLILICNKNVRLSELSTFALLITVVLIAIFCWYLHIYECKIQKVISKGGDVNEIEDVYKKQILNLMLVLGIAHAVLMMIYYVVDEVSAKVITYLFSSTLCVVIYLSFFPIPKP